MTEQVNLIPARLKSAVVGGHVAGAADIIDDNKGKTQNQINAEVDEELTDRYTKEETYNKTELNNMITTPEQEYVSVTATDQTTDVTDVLPATGEADTVYRVGNWDGTQYNDSVFSEYAWNGSAYIKLNTKSQVGEVYDISANHADTKYADLAAALGTNGSNIPQNLRKGGISVKFVQSSDNKYVQYRLMSDTFNTTPANWQGVDDESTAGSDNFVKSGGIEKRCGAFDIALDKYTFSREYIEGEGISTNILFPFFFKKNTVYGFKLTENATVSSVYFYVKYKGADSLTQKGIIGTGYGDKSFDEDVEAFAIYESTSPNTNRTVEFTIDLKGQDVSTRLGVAEEDIDSLKTTDTNNEILLLNENSNIAYGGIVRQFKANKASEIKLVPYSFVAGVPYYIRLSQNSGKEDGFFYVRYENESSNTNLTSISKTAKKITLDRNAVGFAYYSASTPETDYTIGIEIMRYDDSGLIKKIERIDNVEWNNYSYLGNVLKKTISFEEPTDKISTPIRIKEGDTVLVNLKTITAKGTLHFYFMDANYNNVYYNAVSIKNSDGNIGNSFTYTATADCYYFGYYISQSSSIVQTGTIDIEIYNTGDTLVKYVKDLKSFDISKMKYDILLAPCDKTVSGKSGYVFEKILDVSVVEGELIYTHLDNSIGTIYDKSTTVLWYNSNNEIIRTDYNDNYDFVRIVPSSATRMVVRLYPYRGGTVTEVTAEYKNLFILRGVEYANLLEIQKPNDYYFEDNYLNNKVIRINNLYKSVASHGDIFPFITDEHYDGSNQVQSYKLLHYITQRTGIKKLFSGGDIADGINDGRRNFITHINRLGIKCHLVNGNHEYLNFASDSELMYIHNPNEELHYKGSARYGYYYFDDNFKKIRYIILAAYGESEGTISGNHTSSNGAASRGYSEEQMEWLRNKALTEDVADYDIIIFTHRLFEIDINNDVVWNHDMAPINIISKFKSDYNAHIIILAGHAHRDRIVNVIGNNEGSTEGFASVPVLVTTCDKNKPWPSQAQIENPESEYYGWRQDLNVDRTTGTINEQAFDVCIIDTESHTLTAVRIGAKARDGEGNNPGENLVEERSVTY